MAKTPGETKKRPPNPACSGCNHPQSFHARKDGRKKRPCNAFGCDCKSLTLEKAK